MTVSLEELRRLLTKLSEDIPALVATHPETGDFNAAFTERAGKITDAAGVDEAWAFSEVDGILQQYNGWHPKQHHLPRGE